MINPRHPLELNIGFLITASVGTRREFTFDYNLLQLGDDLSINEFSSCISFSRTQQGLLLEGRFSANINLECVRCLDIYSQDLTNEFTELFAFNKRSLSESNLLVPEGGRIDLAPLFREFVLLEIPIQPICSFQCKGLCPICGENTNLSECEHQNLIAKPSSSELKEFIK